MNLTIIAGLSFCLASTSLFGQKVTVLSPNHKITVGLFSTQGVDAGEWYLKASYNDNGKTSEAIPKIDLGLSRSDQDFSKELRFIIAGKPLLVNEKYTALHGKRSECFNAAN